MIFISDCHPLDFCHSIIPLLLDRQGMLESLLPKNFSFLGIGIAFIKLEGARGHVWKAWAKMNALSVNATMEFNALLGLAIVTRTTI